MIKALGGEKLNFAGLPGRRVSMATAWHGDNDTGVVDGAMTVPSPGTRVNANGLWLVALVTLVLVRRAVPPGDVSLGRRPKRTGLLLCAYL